MNQAIPAIYRAGVFHPLQPVDCPDGARAEVSLLPQSQPNIHPEGGGASWPTGYFEQTAGALAGEEFERPFQPGFPEREAW